MGCAGAPRTLGPVEAVRVVELGLVLPARIDTGAEYGSLHATDVSVRGDRVSFRIGDLRYERPLHDVARVRSALGEERRPRVRLHLALAGVEKAVVLSLRDRSALEHPLLVGRDFLAGDFVVDVSRETEASDAMP